MAEIKKINTDLQIEARLLDSNGSAGASGQILSSTGTANYVAKWSDTDTITNSVIYDDGTNVGIGTSSPSGKLEVNTGSSAAYFTRTAGDDGLLNPVVAIAADSSKGLIAASGDSLSFRVRAVGTSNPLGGNTVMSLLSSGNVGIGTTSPNNILHLGGSANKSIRVDTALSNSAFFTGWQDSAAIGVNRNPFNGTFTDTAKAASSIFLYGQASSSYITFSTTNTNNTNPTERMRIDSSGNINIGTTSASTVGGTAKMTIDVGAFTASPVSIVNGTTDGMYIRRYSTGGSYQLQTTVGSGNSGNLSLQSYGGNVGIGTTSPGYTLDVNGTLHSSNITLADGIYHEGDTNTYINFLSDQIQMATAGSVRAYINSLGNVGIGTTNPASQLGSTKVLDVSSTGNGEIILDHTDAGVSSDIGLYSWNRNNDHLAHIKASCDGATDSAFISFHTQATGGSFTNAASNERVRITSTGNVGIGTNSPASRLHVQQTLDPSSALMVYFEADRTSSTYGGVNVRVDNLDYGTGMRFYKSGIYDSNAIGFLNGSSTVGNININASSTSYNTTSDYRLKENVTSITDGITRVKQLQPKRFNFIGDTSVVDGFIAHEAKQVVPEAVTGEKDEVLPNGDPVYQGIDQAKLVPLLTAALQDAITKIEELETRIQTLENK